MIFKRVAALSAFILSLGLSSAHAQALRNVDGPANFPPASFKGKQFIDNNGCAFVRAGIDGRVNWIPRVSRSRKLLCGMAPTFSGQEANNTQAASSSKVTQIVPKASATPAPAPAAKQAPKPAPRVADATPTTKPVARKQQKPVQRQAKPAPRVAAAQPQIIRPAAQQQRVVRTQPALQPQVRRVQPAPQRVVKQQPVQRQQQIVTRNSSCSNFTGISAQYAGSGEGVRCGPQGQSPSAGAVTIQRQPVTVVRNGQRMTVQKRVVQQPVQQQRVVSAQKQTGQRIVTRDPQTGQINAPGNTRVVPRHVYNEQQRSKVTAKVPEGYRKAWDDDRLNPNRAHMTVNGIRQSDLIWTRTLPRKLYIKDTGRVVNNLFPQLRYPYTSMADQNAAMGLTTSSRSKPAAAVQPQRKQQKAAATAGNRYVQVGMFANPANAQRAAQRIAAAGLPARLGTLNKGGKSYRLVMAGPFNSNQVMAAVATARRAGFADAYAR
jgi:SPOR domain